MNPQDNEIQIIGAGMSGLAAAIRLAHFGRHVTVLEKHNRVGGLNSYYKRAGLPLEVGLHAMTNFASSSERSAPLNRLCRQLRIPYDALAPKPQRISRIRVADTELPFSNDPCVLRDAIAETFPEEMSRYDRMLKELLAFDCYALDAPALSARTFLANHLRAPRLRELLLLPLMFYGNAAEHDMDFALFALLFRSVFLEGLWRPTGGIRALLTRLTDRLDQAGGSVRLSTAVRQLTLENEHVVRLGLDNGETLAPPSAVLSTIGLPETLTLCRPALTATDGTPWTWPEGRLGFVETVLVLDVPVRELGFGDTVRFECQPEIVPFARPERCVDDRTRVLCAPGNFETMTTEDIPAMLKITRLADPRFWCAAEENAYREAKNALVEREIQRCEQEMPGLRSHITTTDCFTPKTVARYTGRHHGAVYGSPQKRRSGLTPVDNLFVAGTDQGFLGITGSLLSGISIANAQLL